VLCQPGKERRLPISASNLYRRTERVRRVGHAVVTGFLRGDCLLLIHCCDCHPGLAVISPIHIKSADLFGRVHVDARLDESFRRVRGIARPDGKRYGPVRTIDQPERSVGKPDPEGVTKRWSLMSACLWPAN
jgi:hypothetical protein